MTENSNFNIFNYFFSSFLQFLNFCTIDNLVHILDIPKIWNYWKNYVIGCSRVHLFQLTVKNYANMPENGIYQNLYRNEWHFYCLVKDGVCFQTSISLFIFYLLYYSRIILQYSIRNLSLNKSFFPSNLF